MRHTRFALVTGVQTVALPICCCSIPASASASSTRGGFRRTWRGCPRWRYCIRTPPCSSARSSPGERSRRPEAPGPGTAQAGHGDRRPAPSFPVLPSRPPFSLFPPPPPPSSLPLPFFSSFFISFFSLFFPFLFLFFFFFFFFFFFS